MLLTITGICSEDSIDVDSGVSETNPNLLTVFQELSLLIRFATIETELSYPPSPPP